MQSKLNASGNLNRSSPPCGSRTKMVRRFKAGNHLRFAAALVAISLYANAFTTEAQVAPDIASTSGSASGTPTLNLRVQVMPGGTPPLASNAPSVGPFDQEVTSLENRRIEFSPRPYLLRKFVHSPLENAEPGFCRVPGRQLWVRRFAPERLRSVCVPPGFRPSACGGGA